MHLIVRPPGMVQALECGAPAGPSDFPAGLICLVSPLNVHALERPVSPSGRTETSGCRLWGSPPTASAV